MRQIRFALSFHMAMLGLMWLGEPLATAGINRGWKDAGGERQVYAELLDANETHARLRRDKDKKVVTVAIDRLSPGDQHLLRYWRDESKRPAIEKFAEIGYVNCDKDGGIHLGLSQSGVTDNDLALAASLPETTSIDVFETPLTDDGLAVLAKLPALRSVSINETEVKGPGFKYLAGATALEEFDFSPYDSDADLSPHLAHLAGCPKLKKLIIRFNPIGAEGTKTIGRMTNLEHLEMWQCELAADTLADFANLHKLTFLYLDDVALTKHAPVLENFQQLRDLTLLGPQASETSLTHIAKLPHLERLLFHYNVSDGALAPLSEMTQLKLLRLGSENVTDAGMAHLAALVNLEELALPENITGAGLRHLAKLTKLKKLDVEGEGLTFSDCMRLLVDGQGRSVRDAIATTLYSSVGQGREEITSLSLDFRPRADLESMKYISRLTELENLSLGEDTTDAWLAELKGLTKLKRITFRGARYDERPIKLSAAGLEHLAGLSAIEDLEFDACDLGPGALAAIGSLPNLKMLWFSDTTLAAGNVEAIGKFTSLEQLLFNGMHLTDEDMAPLEGLTNLSNLGLPDAVTAKGVAHFANCKKIRTLQWSSNENFTFASLMDVLTNTWQRSRDDALNVLMQAEQNEQGKITSLHWAYNLPKPSPEELQFLEELDQLTDLGLPKGLTNDELVVVANLTGLKELSIESEEITDEGLEHLKNLKNLESLWTHQCPITDAGLVHLAGLTKLKRVNLNNSKITKAGIDKLQQALPGASISK
ncbi:MAG: hypothetical protein KDA42_16385 [Planctomycetales bacterium]|nr:hypothetical protein [Planctomycetales bacterium]